MEIDKVRIGALYRVSLERCVLIVKPLQYLTQQGSRHIYNCEVVEIVSGVFPEVVGSLTECAHTLFQPQESPTPALDGSEESPLAN